jgi:RNA polymerase sigma-70 factor (ECF subfamily)
MRRVVDRWLTPLFLGDLDAQLRERFAHVREEDLEALLSAAYENGRIAWPEIELDASQLVRHIATVLHESDLEGAIETSLTSLHASDLYLACACAYGQSIAIATLERDFISQLDAPLRSTGLTAHAADDVKQYVREHLLVGAHGVPGIASYRGRGQLRSWLRAISIRQAMLQFRGKRETPIGDSELEAMPAITNDPELAPWKAQYAAAFRVAFEQAIAALDERQRNLLRQHHLDRLSIDALATLHRVHRATAARWVAAARETLLAGVREHITRELAISSSELDSAFRLARSQLDVSIHRLLGAKRPRRS